MLLTLTLAACVEQPESELPESEVSLEDTEDGPRFEKGETGSTVGCQCQNYWGTYYLVCGYPNAPYTVGKC